MYHPLLRQSPRKIALLSAALILLVSMTGCGNKGDLFLPPDKAATLSAAPTNSEI